MSKSNALVYAIRHKPTGRFMPQHMGHSSLRGFSYWEPTDVNGGYTPHPRLFYTKRAAHNALTAWLRGMHRREVISTHDWEGIPDYDESVVVDAPATPRVRKDMELVLFVLVEVSE